MQTIETKSIPETKADNGLVPLTRSINAIGEAFEAFKENMDDRMSKVEGAAGPASELQERIEELEAMASSPGKTASIKSRDSGEREHVKRFDEWLRKPNDSHRKNELGEIERRLAERKAVSIGSDVSGGFAVPEEISREIERLELQFSPVRRLVRVRQVGSNDNKHLLNLRGATAGWVGESGGRTETNTSLLRERAPTMGELYAYPQASEWSLDDVFFNVGAWLAEEAAQQFALLEGEAVIRGNGTNQPTGMLDTTPVLTADFASPLRAAAAYQYIASDTALSPAAPGVVPDRLIDLVYSVASQYRANGMWTMNSTTAAAVRKLKDGQGNYLWQPSLIAGQPERLLGYPVETWEQMDDIGANNFPIAFGDFSRGYLLADRVGLRITIDSNITTPGRIKYYIRRREGGCVYNNDAVKWLRTI